MYYSQAFQDKFILHVLKEKKDGFFLEIGSNHPIINNNTYILEKNYGWKGILVENDASFLTMYNEDRPNSIPVINDATKVDYKYLLETNNMPVKMDYLQIDLEVNNRSTLTTLELFDSTIFDAYTFAVVTFEHDIYSGNHFDTRAFSREIFKKRGYIPVFEDVCDHVPNLVFEDWYVHPDLVDMNYVEELIAKNTNTYRPNSITGEAINCQEIRY